MVEEEGSSFDCLTELDEEIDSSENGMSASVRFPVDIHQLDAAVEASPWNIALYKFAVNHFRNSWDVVNLRRYRAIYSLFCNVDEDFWLQWIEDERKTLFTPGGALPLHSSPSLITATPPASASMLRSPPNSNKGSISSLNENHEAFIFSGLPPPLASPETTSGSFLSSPRSTISPRSCSNSTGFNENVQNSQSPVPAFRFFDTPSLRRKPYPPFTDEPLDFGGMCNLYELAAQSSPTIDLWLSYINFLITRSPNSSQPKSIRKAFERALNTLGLHALDGPNLWSAYRAFETKILEHLSDVYLIQKQVEIIRKLFYRQLKLPLGGLQDLFDEYRVWEEELPETLKVSLQHGEDCHQIGFTEWEKRKTFEMRAQSEMDDLANIAGMNALWNDYLSFELNTNDPSRIYITYLRALEDLGSFREDLWLAFTEYIADTLKNPKGAILVYSQSVKHFPSYPKLWINYMLCLSDNHAPLDDIYEVFFWAIKGCNDKTAEVVDIHLTCSDCVRRCIEMDHQRKSMVVWTPVRNIFQMAEKFAKSRNVEDPLVRMIWQHWARFETVISKDIEWVMTVCENLVERFGSAHDVWLNYIQCVRQLLENTESAYSVLSPLFQRALKQVEDQPKTLKQEWMQFEVELGNPHSIRLARKVVDAETIPQNPVLPHSHPCGTYASLLPSDGPSALSGEGELAQYDPSKEMRKSIVCLSSIRSRRDKRRRKGDTDVDTSSEASSDSGLALTTFKKSRGTLLPVHVSDPMTCHGEASLTSLLATPSAASSYHKMELIPTPITAVPAPQNPPYTKFHLGGPVSPKSSPTSGASSRSRSPSPLPVSPNSRSRSPSPSYGNSSVSSPALSIGSSGPYSIGDVERVTRATWDGLESADPSMAPNVPPLDSVNSPVHTSTPRRSLSLSDNDFHLSDMPPPPYTPRRPQRATTSSSQAMTAVEESKKKEDIGNDDYTTLSVPNDVEMAVPSITPFSGKHYRQQQLGEKDLSTLLETLKNADEGNTLWVSNIDSTVAEEDLIHLFQRFDGFKEVRLVKDYQNHSRGFAYVEFSSPSEASAVSNEMNGYLMNERPMKVLISRPTKQVFESRTAFLCDIPEDCSNEKVRLAIQKAGIEAIKDVRLKLHENGKCLGYGFVEFLSEESLSDFIKLDRKFSIEGVLLKISLSIPMKDRRHVVAPANKRMKKIAAEEKNIPKIDPLTMYVKNLSFSVVEKDLKEHFQMAGEVDFVVICRYSDQKSRGYGFVKFKKESDCFSSLMLNDSELGGRRIVVSRSTREVTTPKSNKSPNRSQRTDSTVKREPGVFHGKSSRIAVDNLVSAYHSEHKDEAIEVADKSDHAKLDKQSNDTEEAADNCLPRTNEEFRKLFLSGKL
ncbi:hypothetical protein IE077_000746 [Cardiosporidium cionae]|uniref:RRM domain-containing protein n=1 Tax=Cardiosporidium cionae TaxID=476202 RepID=A0ABQ7J6L3_9APIC|nr:hypothetical protein IE077_000746 [Cardiosporidium cionae]|eukprot:KAF8819631.1 hypothetical protein IE077_000746 [Cardiosporidium cionae]